MKHIVEDSAREIYVSTFSITGFDPDVPAWGIAIASRFLAVGALSTYGAPDAGVVVVQANLNAAFGPRALEALRGGLGASDAVDQVLAGDFNIRRRQLAIIDRHGGIAAYSGPDCNDWSGKLFGKHCVAMGNTLAGEAVCRQMVDRFASTSGTLARRLTESLAAGDAAGGDRRGRQAAALFVVSPSTEPAKNVFSDPTIDLRVDDHPQPFGELARLLGLYELLYLPTQPSERLPRDESNVSRVQVILRELGEYTGEVHGRWDESVQAGYEAMARKHNLRNRTGSHEWLDRRVLEHFESKIEVQEQSLG